MSDSQPLLQPASAGVQTVRQVLQSFQDGYTRRDLDALPAFLDLFSSDPALEVVGTGGSLPGDDEWPIGRDAVRRLVENDWQSWGDLRLDVEGARIFVHGTAAWLATTATVYMHLPLDPGYQNFLGYIGSVLEKPDLTAHEKLLDILRGGTNTLYEFERGEDFTWALRFTAVLVLEGGQWRFHQLQFSYPTTRFPDVRLKPGSH
jgi:hypothetical protein